MPTVNCKEEFHQHHAIMVVKPLVIAFAVLGVAFQQKEVVKVVMAHV